MVPKIAAKVHGRTASSPNRIVRIVGANGGGGARIHCYQLNRHLESLGWQTLTFIPTPSFDDPFTAAPRVAQDGLDYRHETGLVAMLRALWPIRDELAFLHSHLMRATLRGHILSWLLGVPHVVTVHTPVYDRSPTRKDRLALPLWRRAVERARLVIAISRFIQHHAWSQLGLGISIERDTIVYNGTDDPGPAEPSTLRDALHICLVGELTDRKNIPDLLWMAQQLRSRTAGPRFVFHVFGTGPYADALRAANANIILHGYQTNPTVIYRGRHLHMILSKQEAFGRVITEAMWFGVPTLCLRAGAFPELIRDGEDGMLAASREEALARLVEIADQPDQLAAMAKAARASYEAYFSTESFCRETLRALEGAGLLSDATPCSSRLSKIGLTEEN